MGCMEFKSGDWIEVTEGNYAGAIGYIKECPDEELFHVKLVRGRLGGKLLVYYTFEITSIKHAALESGYDTSFLIDFALDTKDREWFYSLLVDENTVTNNKKFEV
jgi:hypothetical protein